MPRLRDRGVLAQAIVKGAATRDFFGTAYGQSGDTFEGFKFGDSNVQFDDTLLLIEPGAASAYEATHPAKPDSSAPLSSQIPGSVAGAVELLTSDATKPDAIARSFTARAQNCATSLGAYSKRLHCIADSRIPKNDL
jgi:hypothetical protein